MEDPAAAHDSARRDRVKLEDDVGTGVGARAGIATRPNIVVAISPWRRTVFFRNHDAGRRNVAVRAPRSGGQVRPDFASNTYYHQTDCLPMAFLTPVALNARPQKCQCAGRGGQ